MFPDNGVDLIVNRRDCFASGRDSESLSLVPRAFVVGMTTRPLYCSFAGDAEIFGIRFLPGRAAPLVGGILAELADDRGSVADLGSPLLERLAAILGEAPDFQVAIARATLVLVAGEAAGDVPCARGADLIEGCHGAVAIGGVAAAVGLSLRQFERRFRQQVGLSPKTFARIARFQTTLKLLRRQAGPDIGQVSLECGYADQAHLCREFNRFTAMPPAYCLRWLNTPLAVRESPFSGK